MKNSILVLLVLSLISTSCQKREEIKSSELPTSPKGNVVVFNDHRFVFVGIITKIPILDKFNLVEWKHKTYFSDIIEVNYYNEDKKYRILDSVQNGLTLRNDAFITQVQLNVHDPQRIGELSKNKPKMLDRIIFEYRTYHEASEKLYEGRLNNQNYNEIVPQTIDLNNN